MFGIYYSSDSLLRSTRTPCRHQIDYGDNADSAYVMGNIHIAPERESAWRLCSCTGSRFSGSWVEFCRCQETDVPNARKFIASLSSPQLVGYPAPP